MNTKKPPRGFWDTLPKPFFVLAPMADVTDAPFRQMFVKYSEHGKPYGGPHVFWTEFVSCDGLCSQGRDIIKRDLEFQENERPIVAQIFGSNPDNCRKTAELVNKMGFDGIDINMGCPDRSIEKQGAGAAMIKTPKLAQEVIYATQEGAGDIPVSVKTRIGYNKEEIDEWIPYVLETKVPVITVHGRTRKELSLTDARWDDIAKVVEMAKGTDTLIIGNGDVQSLQEAQEKAETYGVDGVMIGRGVFGDPWFFADVACAKHNCHIARPPKLLYRSEASADCTCISIDEKLRVLIEHTKLFEKKLGDIKNFAIMKKHFKAYVTGFDGAKELRIQLMETRSAKEVENVISTFLKTQKDV